MSKMPSRKRKGIEEYKEEEEVDGHNKSEGVVSIVPVTMLSGEPVPKKAKVLSTDTLLQVQKKIAEATNVSPQRVELLIGDLHLNRDVLSEGLLNSPIATLLSNQALENGLGVVLDTRPDRGTVLNVFKSLPTVEPLPRWSTNAGMRDMIENGLVKEIMAPCNWQYTSEGSWRQRLFIGISLAEGGILDLHFFSDAFMRANMGDQSCDVREILEQVVQKLMEGEVNLENIKGWRLVRVPFDPHQKHKLEEWLELIERKHRQRLCDDMTPRSG